MSIFQEALNEEGAGGSRGPISLAEKQRNMEVDLGEEYCRKIDILFLLYILNHFHFYCYCIY